MKRKVNRFFNALMLGGFFALAIVLSVVLVPIAASETNVRLEKVPDRLDNLPALQRGARLFINYCLNCHSARAVRYNTLEQIGFSPEIIKKNLLLMDSKIGDMMETALRPEDAKKWFGVVPPDLSLIARARSSSAGSGADWLYTYMRSFYHDPKSETGWNNTVFPNVAMPNVFWELQGTQILEEGTLKLSEAGLSRTQDFDNQMADLVTFMSWMAEPYRSERIRTGFWVIGFLLIMALLAYLLKKNYWKDIK